MSNTLITVEESILCKTILTFNPIAICEALEQIKFSDFSIMSKIGKDMGISFRDASDNLEELQKKYDLFKYLDELDQQEESGEEINEKILREVFELKEIQHLSNVLINIAVKVIKERLNYLENLNSDNYTDINS